MKVCIMIMREQSDHECVCVYGSVVHYVCLESGLNDVQ